MHRRDVMVARTTSRLRRRGTFIYTINQSIISLLTYDKTHMLTLNTELQYNKGKGKGKGFPYSLPSVGPGADPGVQAVSPQVT